MGQHTDIQWADSTVNPTTGCDGCELWTPGRGGPCYAGNFHEKRLARSLPVLYAPSFTEVRLAPGRMAKAAAWPDLTGKPRADKPWLDGLPRLIFVGDLGDIFSKDVPFEYLKSEVIDVAMGKVGRRHIWMLLTKQPQRAAEFHHWMLCPANHGLAWPENVWVGTSLTNRRSLGRLNHLVRLRANLFASAEPLTEDIVGETPGGLASVLGDDFVGTSTGGDEIVYSGVRMVIFGGESTQGKHKARPFDLRWARRLIALCREKGVAAHCKQLGSNVTDTVCVPYVMGRVVDETLPVRLKDHHGGDWDEWPRDIRVREMPGPLDVPSPARQRHLLETE